MSEISPLSGELQLQVMSTVWRLESADVEEVRGALPDGARGARTTIQTVLNRLADRGLLTRKKRGNRIIYAPTVSETEYWARSIHHSLAAAPRHLRPIVVAELLGSMSDEEAELVQKYAESLDLRSDR